MHHIIIGAGPAGIVAAETLRKLDPDSQITIIGDEPQPPYSRMAMPYLLMDRIDERGTHLRKADDHYQRNKIALVQDRVTHVDPSGKQIGVDKGAGLRYDKLLVATGSHPIAPSIAGIDLEGVYPCWTLDDARHIMSRAQPGAKVVLMGAGFIGCIILEALVRRGVDLSVVEMDNRMVPRMMNEASGNLIKNWCERKGVKVFTSTRVEVIEKAQGDPALSVRLDNGTVLPAALIISATGVKPNIDFLRGAGLKADVGLLIDEHMRTSDPHIYAAGDVAQGKDFSTGGYSVQAIQPTAADHGRIAASNMVGFKIKHLGSVNMNVLDTMGLISSSFGLWMGVDGGDCAELSEPNRYRYLNLQFQDDVLVGASSLGLTEHVGVIRGLIQSKTRLKDWKPKLMEDPTRLMEAYLARTQAIGHNARVLTTNQSNHLRG